MNIYSAVTNQIIKQIEDGAPDYRMPWHNAVLTPTNAFRRSMYNGINILNLWSVAQAKGYKRHEWATANQWAEAGCRLKRGSRPTMVIYANHHSSPEAPQFRAWSVFSGDQVQGWKSRLPEMLSESERIANAERFFATLNAKVCFGRSGELEAAYSPKEDTIVMPSFGAFEDAHSYYSVLAHEHVHWTGIKKRCKRKDFSKATQEAYAFEELVAELGAAFLCARLGLANRPRKSHASYISHWLMALRNDPKTIFRAASQAQKAVDWMINAQTGRANSKIRRVPSLRLAA